MMLKCGDDLLNSRGAQKVLANVRGKPLNDDLGQSGHLFVIPVHKHGDNE